MLTIEQQIARKQDELNRLKSKQRKLEAGQKIVIGGLVLSLAKNNPKRARQLLEDINQNITRKADLDRLQGVIEELSVEAQKLRPLEEFNFQVSGGNF